MRIAESLVDLVGDTPLLRLARLFQGAPARVLAIHHSHPASPSRPSAEDIRLALTPDVLYTILSLQEPANPALKAFAICEGVVTEHPLAIEA